MAARTSTTRTIKYEVTVGWTSMARPYWEYKNAGENGQYMRYVPSDADDSASYKHKIAFQYFGDPPSGWWKEWEKKAKEARTKRGGPAVNLVDYRTRGTSRKRKTPLKAYCVKCEEEIKHISNERKGFCIACSNKHRKQVNAQKKEAQRNLALRETEMRTLQDQVNTFSENNDSLKTENDVLRHKIERISAEAAKNASKYDRQLSSIRKQQEKAKAEAELGGEAMARVATLFMDIAAIFKSLDATGKRIMEVRSLCAENRLSHEKLSKEKMRFMSMLQAVRLGVDIKHGLFAKTLIDDIYRVGVFYCSSKHRGYGTISERRGNIMKYNSELKRLIEEILGVSIPIIDKPEHGTVLNMPHLSAVLTEYGYNFEFAIRDIVRHPRETVQSLRQHSSLMYDLYLDTPPCFLGAHQKDLVHMQRDAFKEYVSNEEDFQNLFLSLYHYHRRNGLHQQRPLYHDYSDYEFYENEIIRIGFVREREERLHLQMYCTTRRYKYCEPNLIKVMH
jgi:hypothetical protein